MNLTNVYSRVKFNRTMDINLIKDMGLTKKSSNILEDFITKGKVPENYNLYGDYKDYDIKDMLEITNNDERMCNYCEKIIEELSKIAHDEEKSKIVRLLSESFKSEDLRKRYSYLMGYRNTFELIINSMDLLNIIEDVNISIKQGSVKFPILVKEGEKYTLIYPRKKGLINSKKMFIYFALLHQITGLLISPPSKSEDVLRCMASCVDKTFLKDDDYVKLVLLSLQNKMSINDFFFNRGLNITDYEHIYDNIGIIPILKGGLYTIYKENEIVNKVRETDIIKHI